MVHGGYDKSRKPKKFAAAERRPKSSSLSVKNQKKPKCVSLKNQIRSTQRILQKNLDAEIKEYHQKKLDELRKQQDLQTRLAVERKIFLRDRKIKFFERRKIERTIRRLEKQQRTSNNPQDTDISEQLSKLKEDLEYVRFFPKTEKYVSLFIGGDEADTVDKRNQLREKIKTNIQVAAASGKDLEETGSEDDGLLDMSEDDFFLGGSSSDEADADDEWTDKKATSGMSSDDKNQRQVSARALMPPPRPSKETNRGPPPRHNNQRGNNDWSKKPKPIERTSFVSQKPYGRGGAGNSEWNKKPRTTIERVDSQSTSFVPQRPYVRGDGGDTSSVGGASSSYRSQGSSNYSSSAPSSNLSSNSDAHKPRRKRRPKKKKQQGN